MKIKHSALRSVGCWLFVVLAVTILPYPAVAALGGDLMSVQYDQAHLKASIRTTQNTSYTMHEMTTPNGGLVREFVDPGGKVFGVAWQGPVPPDLRQVLGTYFDQFVQAQQQRQRMGRGPVEIVAPGLVVHAGGHLRSFSGSAYLPLLMPQGVSAESIR